MLRVTIELLPGGRESGERVIATADIVRASGGALADYRVYLKDAVLGWGGRGLYRARLSGTGAQRVGICSTLCCAALNQGAKNCHRDLRNRRRRFT